MRSRSILGVLMATVVSRTAFDREELEENGKRIARARVPAPGPERHEVPDIGIDVVESVEVIVSPAVPEDVAIMRSGESAASLKL